jgi:hypothetical protein
MNLIRRAILALRENGLQYVLSEALPHVHNHYIRDHVKRRETKLNGVKTRYKRIGDDIVPWRAGHPTPEDYESGIVDSLRTHVREGDEVVVVGCGWGVSATVAAKTTGSTGQVTAYEASPKQAEFAQETIELNGIEDQVDIKIGVVSQAVSTYNSDQSKNIISPSYLPECDVLEMDCEGAEMTILDKLEIRPRIIIVETHGVFDSPTELVIEKLKSRNYKIESQECAETGEYEQMCHERDVKVVTAIRND